jgi:hypothetical protein
VIKVSVGGTAMSDFRVFGEQLREVLIGLLRPSAIQGENQRLPGAGEDVIHPQTSMTVDIFGVGSETIDFAPEDVTLRIRRSSPRRAENGLMTIDTEMTELHMTGESKLLGKMRLRGGSAVVQDAERRITGAIIETRPGAGLPAHNFFDVLLEIETERGVFLNRKPEHMVATITDIPPNFAKTPYQSTTEINLYPAGQFDAAPVGVIRAVQHKSA